ncbi:hypothetical protein AXG93_3105s1070 [Marchantia polymorpha subsp. ruderalis]|uniref:Uncharacterized protein n=1 Tax=Marchantia polymorpha subsp. ruderalis TaxID=1480154 RepID=A0A176WIZ2_MARPO|nr:hypothetical protein AXG93_3105s1070 [Marchantia polymorpha subsp. ruderalis]
MFVRSPQKKEREREGTDVDDDPESLAECHWTDPTSGGRVQQIGGMLILEQLFLLAIEPLGIWGFYPCYGGTASKALEEQAVHPVCSVVWAMCLWSGNKVSHVPSLEVNSLEVKEVDAYIPVIKRTDESG